MDDRPRHEFAYFSVSSLNGKLGIEGRPTCRFGQPPNLSASWSWDRDRLEVRSDALGFRPLYYWADSKRMVVSESVHPILQRIKNPSLDPVALSVFLRTGLFLGDDTPFLGVRQLGPNSVLTWSPLDGLQVRQGPRPAGALQTGIGRTQAVKRYAELFQDAVTQAVFAGDMGRLVVPLSGGRDSRHIAYALHTVGITPVAYATAMHQPWRADEDARVAKLVCEALGGPHVVIPQPRFCLKNCVVAPRETGFFTDELAWLLPSRDWITSNADTIFDGIGGDMMSAALGQTRQFHESFQARDFKKIIQQLFAQSRMAGWEGILAGELKKEWSPEIAYRRVREELELHAGHHNPARSFYFWNRTRKQIALSPFGLFREVRVESPYLMPELWSFLDGLPFDIVADRAFHDDTIAYAYPTLAHVPYENTEATRPFCRREALGVGVDFLRLLCSFRAIKGFDLTRQLKRVVGSLVDHRVWWSQSGALYLLALLDVPNLEIRIDRPPSPCGPGPPRNACLVASGRIDPRGRGIIRAVTRHPPGEAPRARRAMTDNRFYVIYAP